MKTNNISIFIIAALVLATIGGVLGSPGSFFTGAGHGNCHNGSAPGEGPAVESVNATIFQDSASTVPGINVSRATTMYTTQSFSITVYIVNFTEANNVSNGRRGAGQPANITIQLSAARGNNTDFTIPIWYQSAVVLDGDGDSAAVKFDLTAPAAVAINYSLTVDALQAINTTLSGGVNRATQIIFATASVNITTIARPPAASSGGGGGDRDLWKEETIPGNLLIITFFSIFAVSTILIIKRKKQLKRKT